MTALVFVVGALAAAQDKPAPKPRPGVTVKVKPAAGTTTIDPSPAVTALLFTEQQLPPGVKLVDGVKCISPQARSYFDDPGLALPAAPVPIGKVGQSFRRAKEVVGSVAAYEFENPITDETLGLVKASVWGSDTRSAEHPEEILASGAFLVILSFPDGDETAALFKPQLQARLAYVAPKDWSKLKDLVLDAAAAHKHGDPQGGVMMLQKKAGVIDDYAYAQLLLGQLASDAGDWPTAETAYDRALELHDHGRDRLPDGRATVWAAVNGLALARVHRNDVEHALPALQRAAALARALGDDARTAGSLYELARGLARLQKYDDCFRALNESIVLETARREQAAKDADFAAATQRPEFRKLLGG
ncbi:MAG TPA: hypothetical protein VFY71_15695 [Planctomycetota bacterium]|nr:hypothetical protein [Planctomycetota bacterium]